VGLKADRKVKPTFPGRVLCRWMICRGTRRGALRSLDVQWVLRPPPINPAGASIGSHTRTVPFKDGGRSLTAMMSGLPFSVLRKLFKTASLACH
jgi:hypothetical protein